ncbi:(d)CMP kinase [Spirochaeta africana]|uniref:Cytidylate kinase n=1 Tax=Spirochaeta africana (strain ATCC 700263 / DSM 8902 / Z-7692) TaxID=889378 RepID=H9UJ82_SPIAZ|nr:(d)CMP kinase [Spirochaeta africana]AFG37575.1 cytidylate kinase [Spirochaeta africana DSM 8902]
MVVAIDGPAGTGKSTIARFIAERSELYYVNSGNLYRAVALLALRQDIDPQHHEHVLQCAREHTIDFSAGKTLLDGQEADDELRTDEVDACVAQISRIPEVRDIVNAVLRKIASHTGIVVEGRDMTTVVFPDAEVKIFLDATIDARADRRFQQGTSRLSLEEIRQSIAERDHIDRTKPVGALVQSDDAVYLDTSDLTIQEVCARVMEIIQRHTY